MKNGQYVILIAVNEYIIFCIYIYIFFFHVQQYRIQQ